MRIGMRTPATRKSIGARTSGRATRSAKRVFNPMYGKKGMGWINNASKANYNKVYNKTTFGVNDIFNSTSSSINYLEGIDMEDEKLGFFGTIALIVELIFGFIYIFLNLIIVVFYGAAVVFLLYILFLFIF